jgi:hypothetical protein
MRNRFLAAVKASAPGRGGSLRKTAIEAQQPVMDSYEQPPPAFVELCRQGFKTFANQRNIKHASRIGDDKSRPTPLAIPIVIAHLGFKKRSNATNQKNTQGNFGGCFQNNCREDCGTNHAQDENGQNMVLDRARRGSQLIVDAAPDLRILLPGMAPRSVRLRSAQSICSCRMNRVGVISPSQGIAGGTPSPCLDLKCIIGVRPCNRALRNASRDQLPTYESVSNAKTGVIRSSKWSPTPADDSSSARFRLGRS